MTDKSELRRAAVVRSTWPACRVGMPASYWADWLGVHMVRDFDLAAWHADMDGALKSPPSGLDTPSSPAPETVWASSSGEQA